MVPELSDQQLDFSRRVLGRGSAERPTWPRGYGLTVLERVEKRLHELSERLPPDVRVPLDRTGLDRLHSCEALALAALTGAAAGAAPAWTLRRARGRVIRLALGWLLADRDVGTPTELARHAFTRLRATDDDEGLGPFLAALGPEEADAVVRDTVQHLTNFLGDFPPIPWSWYPVPEYAIRLWSGAFAVRVTADLSIGLARGATAGRVLVDIKTGPPQHAHAAEAALFAAAETLKSKIPPARVVMYYAVSGAATVTPVTPEVVENGERWLLDGAETLTALLTGTRPDRTPGPWCRSCPRLAACDEGREAMGLAGPDPAGDLMPDHAAGPRRARR